MNLNLTDLVRPGRLVNFQYYRDGNLWYETDLGELLFPVPVSDIGNATFLAQDKAILFMRYMRKHIKLANESTNE